MKTNYFLKKIYSKKTPYFIAEIGINHNGNYQLAKKMISAAKKSGADCVKFQSLKAEKYISTFAPKAGYQKKSKNFSSKSQLEIIRDCEISITQLKKLRQFAKKQKIDFLSTPFEEFSLKELIDINVDALKISSCNLTNLPFLKKVSLSKLPIILSTGMGNFQEIKRAVNIFKKNKNPLILMQCTSNYPSKLEDANLSVIPYMKKRFKVPVGYSDHTMGFISPVVSSVLGACVIEKHFTLSRKLKGIDQAASIEPEELKNLITQLGYVKRIIGNPSNKPTKDELNTAKALRRSLVSNKNLKKGHVINRKDIIAKRPGTGFSPSEYNLLVGKKLKKDIKEDEIFNKKHF